MIPTFAFALVYTGTSFIPSRLFSDNMVLVSSATQRAAIFGTATPGISVTLTDSREGVFPLVAKADSTGWWQIELEPHVRTKGEPSFALILTGSTGGKYIAKNVAFGTVLLCSGQSNMALPLAAAYNSSAIIAAANRPNVRLFSVTKKGSARVERALLNTTSGQQSIAPKWTPTTSASIPQFSGVCYLTALHLQQLHHQNDPDSIYGLIDSSVGSTDIQSWMSLEARAAALGGFSPSLLPWLMSDSFTRRWAAFRAVLQPFSLKILSLF